MAGYSGSSSLNTDLAAAMGEGMRPKGYTAVELALQTARTEYARELPTIVRELTQQVRTAKDAQDRNMMHQAVQEAHKLRGSAGSFGYGQISEAAAKVESLIGNLEHDESTMQEILWAEIIRLLADAESAARAAFAAAGGEESEAQATQLFARHAVIIGTDIQWQPAATALSEYNVADATLVATRDDALEACKLRRPDVIFIDLATLSKTEVFTLVRDVRLMPDCHAVPFAMITDANALPSPAEAVFVGASALMQKPLNPRAVSATAQSLIELREEYMPKVLTVDDDDVLCSLIKKVLEPRGLVVRKLNEPIRVVQVLEDFAPDVMLLDVIMPAISGYDVCRMVKQIDRWKDLRIIFLTSKSSAESRAAAYRAGADDFLAKPVVSEEIVSRVTTQMERSRFVFERLERDSLTGLLSRKPFERASEPLIESALEERTPCTMALIEVERFRELSMQFGLGMGEKLLAHLGQQVQARFRAQDVRARLGDFVCIVLPGMDSDTTS
ncbi:MAG: response regulator, partial [Terriglobales bacterium]